MKYMSPKEAAARWRINERTVRRYCEKGLLHGATQVDGLWIISDDTPKPKNIDTEPPIYKGPAKQVVAQRAKKIISGSMSICRSTWPIALVVWPVTDSPATKS